MYIREKGHGKGNSIIYIPSRKIMMYVDTVTPKSVPFKNFAYTIDIFSQIKGIEKALELDFQCLHCWAPSSPLVRKRRWRKFLNITMRQRKPVLRLLKKVSFLDIRGKSKTKDVERLFGEYLDAVSDECYQHFKTRSGNND